MPIRILEKDPVRMKDKKTTAKWITKKPKKMEDKKTTAKWITKKPKKWITKKPKKWITKKSLSIGQAVKDVVAEGGSPKLTTDKARMGRIDKKLGIIPADDHPIKEKGGRAGLKHGGSVGAAIRGRGAEIK